MDLSNIKTFVLVVERRSLAAVSRELEISSAAISKQLTRLEKDLGVQLLVRSTRRVELTEVGAGYYAQCKRILEEVETAEALISQMKLVPHGALKVVSGRHFASVYIVPHLEEFLKQFPDVRLNLELAERMPDLEKENVDVLIGMSLSAEGNAVQRRISTTRYAFCASPAYLWKFGTPKKPADLHQHRYITHSMRTPDCEVAFSNGETVQLIPFLHVNDTETMAKLAEQGIGIVKLHHYVVKEALQTGRLKEVLSAFSQEEIPVHAAYLQRRYVSIKIRAFLDFFIKKCKEQ